MRLFLPTIIAITLLIPNASALAINLTWSGSGSSGSDPLANDWTLNPFAWGIPGFGGGTVPLQGPPGDFVTDFHFSTNNATIISGVFSDFSDGIFWNTEIMDNTIWFTAPAGTQLDVGETFFVNVEFGQILTEITFNAEWTMPVDGIPEPLTATLGLMGLGVLGMATRRRVA